MGYAHGKRWTDEMVENEILNCVNILGLDRMPTKSEIESFYGNHKLTNRISRTQGYYWWAKRLNLKIKKSETTTGKRYEKYVMDVLQEKGYKVEKMTQNAHFDLLLNDCIKVDVKVGKRWYKEACQVNTFGINKKYATCDIYIILVLDDKENVEKTLIVPAYKIRCKTSMSIGKNSKYNAWIDRYDVIDKYLKLMKAL